MEVLIKKWRKLRKLTQEELAERLGVSQPTISRLESGLLPMTISQLSKFSKELQVSMDDLLSKDEAPHA
jgi:transcriptional regulator with XRE-family HTH domain